jgi:fumarate hydratase subunit beta
LDIAGRDQGAISVSVAGLRDAMPDMRAGGRVYLSGDIYTARDAAHKELLRLIETGAQLPFELRGAVVYYVGPTPGGSRAIGSCGPTTSCRMDAYATKLYDLGLSATIGKGERSAAVAEAIVRNGAVYLCAVGGAGALLSKHVISAREVAMPELGCESIKLLTVRDMPLLVGIDCHGGDIFKSGRAAYARSGA